VGNFQLLRLFSMESVLGKTRNAFRTLVEKPKGKYSLRDLCVGRRIILKWILK
jgi:hypothetical protein